MEIRKLQQHELSAFQSLIEIFYQVFDQVEPLPDSAHLARLLARPDFIVFVAMDQGMVRGGLTIYILQGYYGARPSAYLYDLGVAPAYQRQGLGKALVEACFQHCEAQAYQELFVQADLQDVEALNFYRKTRLKEELPAMQFSHRF